MKKILDFVETILDKICMVFLLGMIGVGFLQILLRYFFARPFAWAEELLIAANIWFVFLAAVVTLRNRRHIAVTMVVDLIKSSKVRQVIDLIGKILIAIFLVYLIWGTIKIQPMQASYRTPTLRLPRNYLSISVLISAILMFVITVRSIVLDLIGVVTKRDRQL